MKIAVLGGGQLARMLAEAARPLGISVRFLDPGIDACAASVAEQIVGAFDDQKQLETLTRDADVATYEFENVPQASIDFLGKKLPVFPSALALSSAQDRWLEKVLFVKLGIPTAPFEKVDSLTDLAGAAARIGFPAVLKTRRFGYDGKGQVVIRESSSLAEAWHLIGEVPCILEGFVAFEREVSLIAVRDQNGVFAAYPLSLNVHVHGILHCSEPLQADPLQSRAQGYCQTLMESLDYVGVLALEFFQLDSELYGNEFAPRVHNSGHWTIEGALTSQFENHIRAILGLPLGCTDTLGFVRMYNCIGKLPDVKTLLGIPGVHLHAYEKQPREGRKVGHVTLQETSREALAASIDAFEPLI